MNRAILFPGQGSQYVGMGKELCEAHDAARAWYDRASDLLGFDLAAVSFDGPDTELNRSDRTQPAIFAHSVAGLIALGDRVSFAYCAGHSLGEWAALYHAGVIGIEDGLRALEARGRLMQECAANHPGAMLAVLGTHGPEQLEALCGDGVQVANYNSPVQTVLSGTAEGIAAAEAAAGEARLKAVRLPVAGAFHSPLMGEAAEAFAGVIAELEFRAPAIPVLCNVTGEPHRDPHEIRTRMVEQITASVQWVRSVEWLAGQGVDTWVECGPGRVLTGLVKRIDKRGGLHNIQTADEVEAFLSQFSD